MNEDKKNPDNQIRRPAVKGPTQPPGPDATPSERAAWEDVLASGRMTTIVYDAKTIAAYRRHYGLKESPPRKEGER